jgi:hypothetical protein
MYVVFDLPDFLIAFYVSWLNEKGNNLEIIIFN